MRVRPERAPRGYVPQFRRREAGGVKPSGQRFQAYAEVTGGRIDHVLYWGTLDALKAFDREGSMLRALRTRFELVHVTESRGMARLCR